MTCSLKYIYPIIIAMLTASCQDHDKQPDTDTKPTISNTTAVINYSVISAFPHDSTSFTEGLLVHDGILYESTGYTSELPKTRSLFGAVDLKTGLINTRVELDKNKYFGEGICFFNGKVFQLTYKTKIGFIYDAKTFKQLGEFTFPSEEGWGLTTDSTNLIMSDGGSSLTYLDPARLTAVKVLKVYDENGAVKNINELEYIKGFLYANIYTTNYIIKINPANGMVIGRLDLTTLKNEQLSKYPGSLEMNGIAYNSATGKIYITGKMWPNIYEIQFDH